MLSLFCPPAMAAATAGRSRKRRSKRAAAACEFLSNISLDGTITSNAAKSSDVNTIPGSKFENIYPPVETTSRLVGEHDRNLLQSMSERATGLEPGCTKPPFVRGRSVTSSGKAGSSEGVLARRSMSLVEPGAPPGMLSHSFPSKQRLSSLTVSSFNTRKSANDKRIVLCSAAHKVPFLMYSVLKYHKENQEAGQEGMGVKHGNSSCYDGIEGVEVGSQEKTISFSPFLVPAYPYGGSEQPGDCQAPAASHDVGSPSGQLVGTVPGELGANNPAASLGKGHLMVDTSAGVGNGATSATPAQLYDPLELDDPELVSGRHRTVLSLSSYLVSIIAYAKPSELKKDLNEQFREKFPHLDITLTKLRSLKKDMLKLATSQECQLDLASVAYGFAYFEKLIFKAKVNKSNRKVLAGACLLLAAKFSDDRKGEKIKELVREIDDRFRVPVKELIKFELQALVALEFNLHIPKEEVLPHLKRLEASQA